MKLSTLRRSTVLGLCVLAQLALGGAARAADERKGGEAPPQPQGRRVEVPIQIIHRPSGGVRLAIPVQIGDGPPVEALLDTGSSGLRVLPGGMPHGEFRTTRTPAVAAFGSGVVLRGPVAEAVVRIGGLASAGPIRFQAVDSATCVPQRPQCPAHDMRLEDYRIAADGQRGEGFLAIIGIAMGNGPRLAGVANPLAQLPGDASFMIDLPGYGAERGRLVINPTAAEHAGFTAFNLPRNPADVALPNGVPGWITARLPGCVVNLSLNMRSCGPTLFDTGAESVDIATAPAGTPTAAWPAGTPVRLEIGTPPAMAAMDFTVGQPPRRSHEIVRVIPAGTGGPAIRAGVRPYFAFTVFYDQRNGVMALGQH
jgi:hypothetical protein